MCEIMTNTGVKTNIGMLSALNVSPHPNNPAGSNSFGRSRLLIRLNQGKNRHIRRMISHLDPYIEQVEPKEPIEPIKSPRKLKVLKLKRVRYGNIELGSLPLRAWR